MQHDRDDEVLYLDAQPPGLTPVSSSSSHVDEEPTLVGPAGRRRTPTPDPQERFDPLAGLDAVERTPAPVPPLLPTVQPGQVLGGRWRLERLLGAGGTSHVYAATDLDLGGEVAVKVLAYGQAEAARVLRFRREVELVRDFEHPNIAKVYSAHEDEGLHYLILELLDGADLKQLSGRVFGLAEGLRLVMHACAALGYAHERGVLHRDVKPANLFVTQTHVLKLMDFGLARDGEASGLTAHGALVGTPEYMAPEQISCEQPLGPATDLYALGCVAYQLFTGLAPFRHQQVVPLLMMHLKQQPERPRRYRPQLPEEFEQVILKLLAKNPADRYPNARALQQALAALWPLALRESAGG